MSAAAASPTLCGCGCGHAVERRRFLNGEHKKAFEAARTYPQYTSATERQNRCERHGIIYTQRRYQFEGSATRHIGMEKPAFTPAAASEWMGGCPSCEGEENERLAWVANLNKPRAGSCAARACECLKDPPKCRHCLQPMQLQPSKLPGVHEWACGVVPGVVAVRSVTAGDDKRREMAEPERQRVGEHHRNLPGGTFMTSWRDK